MTKRALSSNLGEATLLCVAELNSTHASGIDAVESAVQVQSDSRCSSFKKEILFTSNHDFSSNSVYPPVCFSSSLNVLLFTTAAGPALNPAAAM